MSCDDIDCDALAWHYETARAHARDIVAAATRSLGRGYWYAAKVPLEADAMTEAIARRMRIGSKMGQADIPIAVIRRAVEGVLGAMP